MILGPGFKIGPRSTYKYFKFQIFYCRKRLHKREVKPLVATAFGETKIFWIVADFFRSSGVPLCTDLSQVLAYLFVLETNQAPVRWKFPWIATSISSRFLNWCRRSAAEYGGGAFARPKGPSSWRVRIAADPLPNTKLPGHSSNCCCLRRINRSG